MIVLFYMLPLLLRIFSADAGLPQDRDELILEWHKAYLDDDIQKSTIGLSWALSYLGAKLPDVPGGMDVEGSRIRLHIAELGFSADACQILSDIHRTIRASDDYRNSGSIDLGRYVTLLLGSSEHYYAITGQPLTYGSLLDSYQLLNETGRINNSSVSRQHRSIRFSKPSELSQLLVATEIDSVTGIAVEFETIDIMPNGQPRFGIYNAHGSRRTSADAAYSIAGKPAKCMWCHESTIQKMYTEQRDYDGYLTAKALQERLIEYNKILSDAKRSLARGIDYTRTQDHTYAELLYISFMEPSAERLALEWRLPVSKVYVLLGKEATHTNQEFPFLGTLYNRNNIEQFAPIRSIPVSSDVREAATHEVNVLK